MKVSQFALVMSGPRTVVVPLQAPPDAVITGIDLNVVQFNSAGRDMNYELPFCDTGRASVLHLRVGDSGCPVDVYLLVPDENGPFKISTQIEAARGVWLAVGSLLSYGG